MPLNFESKKIEQKKTVENRVWESCIGLEIHAQLKTKSKMFSSDSSSFGDPSNQNVSPVSLGFPGALPVLNQKALFYAIKTGLALNCEINTKSIFARKNYFYPDLPKGYQISQYDEPLCQKGFVEFLLDGSVKRVSIQRAHMEEDAGKLIHKKDYSLVNLNRAGVPLLEIVSDVAPLSPREASEYVKMVRKILRYIDACDGNLEEGSMRCDCNVSVRLKEEKKLGTRVEIKNINSFRFIEKALEYEIQRQIKKIEKGEEVVQETRLYHFNKNKTFPLRSKEEAEEYRYFPDPDLLPLSLKKEFIQEIRNSLPELPFQKELRFQKEYNLSEYESHFLVEEKNRAEGFEILCKESKNAKASASWIMGDLTREMKTRKMTFNEASFVLKHLSELIQLIDGGQVSGKMGKEIFLEMWEKNLSPKKIIKEKNLVQIKDPKMIEQTILEVLSENQKQLKQYKEGKNKLFSYFVGCVMKKTKGQTHPEIVSKILKEKLELES